MRYGGLLSSINSSNISVTSEPYASRQVTVNSYFEVISWLKHPLSTGHRLSHLGYEHGFLQIPQAINDIYMGSRRIVYDVNLITILFYTLKGINWIFCKIRIDL